MKHIFDQSALYLAGNIVRRAVGFLMIPLYTHYLTPADYGVIELVELFVSVACISVGISALSDSMVRIYYDYGDDSSRGAVVSTALACTALISLGLALLAFPLAGQISQFVFNSPGYAALIRIAFVAMFFSNVSETALAYQRLRGRAVFFLIFSVTQLAVNLGFNIYFIAYAGMGAWGFVLSKLIYASLGAIVVLAAVLRETGWKVEFACARRMAAFGAPLIVTAASFFIIHFADRFFLSHMGGLADVGIYALAYKFAFLVTALVGEPFGSVWNVTLYRHTSAAQWRRDFATVARYLLFALVLAAVGISALGGQLLSRVASPTFMGAARLIPVLALAYAFREMGDFFRTLMFINKRSVALSRIAASCALLNLGLNWWLVPALHETGAAVTTLITWVVYLAICWYFAQAEHKLPSLLRPSLILSALGAAVFAGHAVTSGMAEVWRVPCDVLLVMLFVLLVWSSGYFPPSERDSIRRYLSPHRLMTLAARWR